MSIAITDWPLWDVYVDRGPPRVVKAPSARWAMTAVDRDQISQRLAGRAYMAERTLRPDLWDGWTATDGARIGDVPDLRME